MDINNKKEAARKKSLGELGELFALKALVDKKFDRIRNLNDNTRNEAFADIECEKDGLRYIISVKARNKYQKNGRLNSRYNLGAGAYKKHYLLRKDTMLLPIGWQYNLDSGHFQYILAL
jgi:hypothetical protein